MPNLDEADDEERKLDDDKLLAFCYLLRIVLQKHQSSAVSKSLTEIAKLVVTVCRKLELVIEEKA